MNNNEKIYNVNYEAPCVEFIVIAVEQGFSASVEPLGNRNEDIDW